MKVIQIPYSFYPDAAGGTEVYVKALSKHLKEYGIESVVAAPTENSSRIYSHEDLKVKRFSISRKLADITDLYGEGDIKAALEFEKILDEEKPDIVNLHAFTRAVSLRIVRQTKKRQIPVFFTYHTPSVSCPSGVLVRPGNKACDGRLYLNRCTGCVLTNLGLKRPLSNMVCFMPIKIGNLIRRTRLFGDPFTALRMRELVNIRIDTIRKFMAEVDHFIATCEWARQVLLQNSVPAGKITLSRHGVSRISVHDEQKPNSLSLNRGPLRLVYLGRIDYKKGLDILIRVLRTLPEIAMELHIYGVPQDMKSDLLLRKLKILAKNDSRIKFILPVPNERVISLIKEYHYLVVPSILFETGPFVVLEAFAAGVPVIGSDIGGIKELIKDGVNGLLVKPASIKDWRQILQWVSGEKGLAERLRKGVSSPRTMNEVAEEMKMLYCKFTKKGSLACQI